MDITRLHILPVILLLLVAAACSRHSVVSDTLLHAEAIMEEHPDSALAILEAIPDSTLTTKADRALHALLLSQALDKNYIDNTSDSLVNIAVDYYQDHGDQERLMKALFYNGIITFNYGDLISTVKNAMNAYEIALDRNDYYWVAKSVELLGDVAGKAKNNVEMAKYTKEASIFYKKAGREQNHRYALCDYAKSMGNDGMFDEASHILDSIRNIALQSPIDTFLAAYTYHASLPILIYSKKFDEASIVRDKMIELQSYYPLNAIEIAFFAQIDLNRKAKDNVENLLSDALSIAQSEIDTIAILYSYSCYYDEIGKYHQAKSFTDSVLRLQNRIVENVLIQSEVVAQRNYYNQKAQESRKERNLLLSWSIIGGIVIVLLIATIVLIILLYRIKAANLRLKVDNLIETISNNQSLKDKSAENSEWLINENPVVERLKSGEGKPIPLDSSEWKGLENLIDSAYPEFRNILSSLGSLSTEQKRMSMLLKMRIPYKTIALAMGRTPQAITMMHQRLFKKYLSTQDDFKSWEDFIERI